ncbi:ABC transporter substrate-binding protein [Glaciibacter superstes]|uniref:ABC transporter substrate-binding protein n=1 Tax=Glaciibacter superstes TaxID=501023 RepID=UPI0003B4A6B9|nr:extracellular solute-binding protein [Glaciibacter superstes]
MKSRVLLLAAASVAAAALLVSASGCSAGSGSDSGSIEFQTFASVDSKLMSTIEEVTARFEEENPDIDLKLVASSNNYEADIKVRLASGNIPDIFGTHGWSLQRYSEFLEPLQDEPWAKNFNPVLDSAMKNDTGEFFAFPVDTDVAGIIYNGDVLDAAGVDPAEITTWEAFEKAADAVKANGITPISVSGKAGGPSGNIADWLAAGAYDESQLAELEAGTFVDEPYSEVLTKIADWREAEYFNPDYSSATSDDMTRALSDGQAAFEFSQNSRVNDALQYNPDANIGFMPVPSMTTDAPYLIGGEMNAYGISKTSKHLEDAKTFIAFLAEPENATALAEAAGNLPGMTNATADLGPLQESFDTYVGSGEYPLMPYFDRVYLPNGMWNTMVTTADSVITGQSDVDQAVGQMASDFKSLAAQDK